MKKALITFLFIFTLAVFVAGCLKAGSSSEEMSSESEYTDIAEYSEEKSTEFLKENQTEKVTNQSQQGERPTQQDTDKSRIYVFTQVYLTEIYVDDKWVSNTDEKFIGNINRIRNTGDYYDIETDLYYSNSVFFALETNNVIQ